MADNLEDDEDKEDSLLQTLRRHLAEDNPNPNNDGCPSREELRAAVFDPTKGNPSLHRHLTSCSGCYLAFEEMLKHGNLKREEAGR